MSVEQVRSKTVRLAVALHWVGVTLLIVAGQAWSNFGGSQWVGVGLFAGLGSLLTGWVEAVIASVKDQGRIRLGAICLAGYPVLVAVLWMASLSSTRTYVNDPITVLSWLAAGIGLTLGTLLVCLPVELGT